MCWLPNFELPQSNNDDSQRPGTTWKSLALARWWSGRVRGFSVCLDHCGPVIVAVGIVARGLTSTNSSALIPSAAAMALIVVKSAL